MREQWANCPNPYRFRLYTHKRMVWAENWSNSDFSAISSLIHCLNFRLKSGVEEAADHQLRWAFEGKSKVQYSRRRVSMNIKLALVALFCGVAMSCNVSEGQLLDRMLSKAGCTVCDSGCGGGLISGGCGVADSCGARGPGILDKIKDRLARVGCGGGCEAAAEPCGCVAPVVESCGCDAAPAGPGFFDRFKDRMASLGSGCGCAAPAGDCGCNIAPAPMIQPTSCGCDAAPACGGGGPGLLDDIKSRLSSVGSGCGCSAPVADCGCDVAPAPAPCDAAPACGGGPGLLDRLKGRMSSIGGGGGCGCDAAPVVSDCGCSEPAPTPCMAPVVTAPCGCDAPAPVASCGGNAGGRIRGAVSGIFQRGQSSAGCGCEVAAPAPSSCGCNAGSASSGRLSLLDRLRGNRVPRDRSGRLIGGGCNDGCNPPCPGAGAGDCGCGGDVVMAAPVTTGCSSCSSCDGGAIMMAAPLAGGAIYTDTTSSSTTEGVIMEAPATAEPAATEAQGVIEKAPMIEGADTPAVDPNAFIIRNGNVRG